MKVQVAVIGMRDRDRAFMIRRDLGQLSRGFDAGMFEEIDWFIK